MNSDSKPSGPAFEIRSYRDFKRLIKGQTSKSMHALYDERYFSKHVGNKDAADSYFASLGLASTKYTRYPLELADIQPGERVIDVGCGRGEIVFQAARAGAVAYGVDYAESAIQVAESVRERHGEDIRSRTAFRCGNAEKLEHEDNTFDVAFLLDVVEHVSSAEFRTILDEIRRILKPQGRLIIHTSPNVWSRSLGFSLKAAALFLLKGKRIVHPVVAQFQMLQVDPEYDEHKILLHINEQSVCSLRRNLGACGFRPKVWLGNTGNPWRERTDFPGKALSALYRISGAKFLFGSDIYAVASPRGN